MQGKIACYGESFACDGLLHCARKEVLVGVHGRCACKVFGVFLSNPSLLARCA